MAEHRNYLKSKAPKIDRRMFEACKIMIENGATNAEVAKYMNLGISTVTRIKKAETFDEYRSMIAAISLELKKGKEKKKAEAAKKAEPAPKPEPEPQPVKQPEPGQKTMTVQVQATHYMMEELRKLVEILNVMNNKLGLIAEDLGCFDKRGEK